jgi:hypothetical protein
VIIAGTHVFMTAGTSISTADRRNEGAARTVEAEERPRAARARVERGEGSMTGSASCLINWLRKEGG